MLHYYLNLCKGNSKQAYAVMKTAQGQFEQFEYYLRNSIEALKRKQISAAWEKVPQEDLAELSIIGNMYEFSRQTVIELPDNEPGYYRIQILNDRPPNFSKKIEYQIGNTEGEAAITEEDWNRGIVRLPDVTGSVFDNCRWGFADISLEPAWMNVQSGEVLYGQNNKTYRVLSTAEKQVTISGTIPAGETISYGGETLNYKVVKTTLPPAESSAVLQDTGETFVFYSQNRIEEYEGLRRINNRARDFIDFSDIQFAPPAQEKFLFNRRDNSSALTIALINPADEGKTVISNKILFKISKLQAANFDAYRIQLRETKKDNDTDEEENALSPLRFFFDEDIKIKDNHKNEYYVERKGSDEDELQIVLRRDPTKEEKEQKGGRYIRPLCFPPEGSTLTVQVDVRPLQRQLEAVSILKLMPLREHEKLLKLFESSEHTRWDIIKNKNAAANWFVLQNENRSGCQEQREFVNKALNTPDFAILEGPPGSGKTTVILELICQLVSQGKRVLLCGSTNVAIDNILERLMEKKNGEASLLEQITLLPVRIGKAERVEQRISDYQIDNMLKDIPENKRELRQRLLLDAANLVCGTTMGIANHPKFREQLGKVWGINFNGKEPVVPEFDCLIIDESSKTTFQEFLVPALYAKRWILAGDVMQLSPFTDRENVEYNFEQLPLGKNEQTKKFETLDTNIQSAVFYLEKMRKGCLFCKDRENNKEYHNRFILPVSSEVVQKMLLELLSGRIERFHKKQVFVFVTNFSIENSQVDQIIVRNAESVTTLEMTGADLIIVDRSVFDSVKEKLPATHALLRTEAWESSPIAFYHNFLQQNSARFGYRSKRHGLLTDSFKIVEEINEELKEGNWAQEIAWRIDSENQLRLVDGSRRREKLGSEIDDLTPYSIDRKRFEDGRNLIATMTFPSILESLVTGIKGKKTRETSTITEGFKEADLQPRKTTLTFQHRMHPEISVFPRSQFYRNTGALRDLELPRPIAENRRWNYTCYLKRSVWVDVKSPTKGSRNIFEVEAMMRHLEKFLDYAVKNEQPEGKDWEVACLAFYRGQEQLIREGQVSGGKERPGLQQIIPSSKGKTTNFEYNKNGESGKYPVHIRLHSVDRFQGHEADVVFLSMSQTNKDGFLDNPNRLNVSITRAKFQLVIFGHYHYFAEGSRSDSLRALAQTHRDAKIER